VRKKAAFGAAVTTALALTASPAAAQGPTFSITPVSAAPFFIFTGQPGHELRGTARVVNVSDTAGTVDLYAVDATTGQTSGAVYQSPRAPRRDVGAWTSLSQTRVALGPHRSATVSFSVAIPSFTRPGQHLGGLVAKPDLVHTTNVIRKAKQSFRVNIEQIAIVAVEVDLPGDTQQMDITGLSAAGRPGYQTLLIGLANTGEALVKGRGRLAVTDAGGKSVLNQTFALDTFVPRTQVQFPIYVGQRRLAAGRYGGTVTIHYGNGHRLQKTFGFSISAQQVRQTFGSNPSSVTGSRGSSSSIPAWALGLGALVLVGLGVGGSALVFRSRGARS
jgi:hypothetical protein